MTPSLLPQSWPLPPQRRAVAQSATLIETSLGRWTDVGPRCLMHGVTLGDYSYVGNDADLMYANVGKFVSIASHVRINPSNHPWWRPTLHHFTYRPGRYGLTTADEPDVDEDIFAWRKQYTVRIGHDVWIGHGAVLLPGVRVGNGAGHRARAASSPRTYPPGTLWWATLPTSCVRVLPTRPWPWGWSAWHGGTGPKNPAGALETVSTAGGRFFM